MDTVTRFFTNQYIALPALVIALLLTVVNVRDLIGSHAYGGVVSSFLAMLGGTSAGYVMRARIVLPVVRASTDYSLYAAAAGLAILAGLAFAIYRNWAFDDHSVLPAVAWATGMGYAGTNVRINSMTPDERRKIFERLLD